jgi:hypothetical protein
LLEDREAMERERFVIYACVKDRAGEERRERFFIIIIKIRDCLVTVLPKEVLNNRVLAVVLFFVTFLKISLF